MTDEPDDPGLIAPAPDHRNAKRDSVLLQAEVRRPGQAESVLLRIRNLSPHGLGGDCMSGMVLGEALIFTLRGIGEVSGRIAWISDSRFGFSFDHEIDLPLTKNPPTSLSAEDRSTPSQANDFKRPGLRPRR